MYSERGKRPLPELRPYPGQVDVALRLVHLRRRRSAALAASAAGLVVVASLLVTARGSGLAVVEPTAPFPLPAASPAPPATTAPAASPAAPVAPHAPAPDPTPFGGTSPSPLVEVAPGTRSPAPPAPGPSGRPPGTRQPRQPVTRHMMRKPAHCATLEPWCATVIKTAKDDVPWFQLLACHPASAGRATLTFEEDREVDFAVVSAWSGEEVWRWSSTEPRPAPNEHTIGAEAGWCFVWTAVWNGLGDDGRPLPAGDYVLQADVLATRPLRADTKWTQQ